MNRRKSIVAPSTGIFDRKPEKKRGPFAALMRGGDASCDGQIPESPPRTASGRPDTSFADHSSSRNPSVSQDRPGLDYAAVTSESQADTTNGAIPESQAGLADNHVNQVGYQLNQQCLEYIGD